jgi:hypothetical protein
MTHNKINPMIVVSLVVDLIMKLNDLCSCFTKFHISTNIEVKLTLCLTNYDVWERGGITSPFVTSALDGGEWSAPRPCRFAPSISSLYTLCRRMDGPWNIIFLQQIWIQVRRYYVRLTTKNMIWVCSKLTKEKNHHHCIVKFSHHFNIIICSTIIIYMYMSTKSSG